MVVADSKHTAELEAQLNDFDPEVRARALIELTSAGDVDLPPESDVVNMHCHTFYSFNAYGYSPLALAWLAKRRGFRLIGIVDFDVLDGVDEFLDVCDMLNVRGSAGIETRVFVPEFASREINSPGEPGVMYHMGIGFTSGSVPDEAAPILADLRKRAASRNWGLITRINSHLAPVTLDYDADVLPLAPGGTPTERHIVAAYVAAAERRTSDPVAFWATKLDVPADEIEKAIADGPRLQNLIRKKLIKRGGVGYVQPGPDTFPSVDAFHDLILACGALPCAAWLDGRTEGEQAIGELLELLIDKGVCAFNIIPDRNWNIADPETKQWKVKNLYDVVELACELDLPLNIGTEMNSFGQRLVDDFDAPELAPVRQAFLDGAHFIYGHTVLQRALKIGYQSEWAKSNWPTRRDRNAFYTQVGCKVRPETHARIRQVLTPTMSPGEILSGLEQL